MKKTIFATSLLLISLFFGTNTLVQASSFSDVSDTHSYLEAIEYVKSQGIVNGYGDGTYKPNQTITRAEFTKILLETQFGSESQNCTENYFSDVDTSQWYAKYICFAKQKSIIQGYGDGTFGPNNSITFSEAAKIISIAFGDNIKKDDSTWYKPYVENLENKKAIPVSIKNFDYRITRGEMAEMIYRIRGKITNKESLSFESLASGGNIEITFDGCGKISSYKNNSWYSSFNDTLNNNGILMDEISEACLSLNETILIAITEGGYCESGIIFQYNISKNIITKATFNDHERGCVSWPNGFGKRNGYIIPLLGFGGDAGCSSTMYYDYNYINNTIELKKECSQCQQGTETCDDY